MTQPRNLVLNRWSAANDALIQRFEGNKSKFAFHVRMSRTTITKFFNEEPISENRFRKICSALRLSWETVSLVDMASNQTTDAQKNNDPSASFSEEKEAETQVRSFCRKKIADQHSRIRLLSGTDLQVDQLYVDVWLLERSPRTRMMTSARLLENFDLEENRLGLSKRMKRYPGLTAANENKKLVILGKPGSGKTTFLKHIAIDWCHDDFEPHLFAVFLELRRIGDKAWNIKQAIDRSLGLNSWHKWSAYIEEITRLESQRHSDEDEKTTFRSGEREQRITTLKRNVEALPLSRFLKGGKLLILMDGLDEVPRNGLRKKVISQLQELTEHYPENRYILTCRTQVLDVIPDGFTSVEVADFDLNQVEKFVRNWFKAHSGSNTYATQQWEELQLAINANPDLKELTATPVLLSLVCLSLQDEGSITYERKWLYEKGIKLLLRRWNYEKQIEGWELGSETYRRLEVEDKEKLLANIAGPKFEDAENFVLFRQQEIVGKIVFHLKLSTHTEGDSILRTIESQNGLLVERADTLWSFSHLTFQEYFAAQWLLQINTISLFEKISSQRWKDVIKQIIKSQQPAESLIRRIRKAIDEANMQEGKLQEFLIWASNKAILTTGRVKPSTMRALYFSRLLTASRSNRIIFGNLCLNEGDESFPPSLYSCLSITLDLALDLLLEHHSNLNQEVRDFNKKEGSISEFDQFLGTDFMLNLSTSKQYMLELVKDELFDNTFICSMNTLYTVFSGIKPIHKQNSKKILPCNRAIFLRRLLELICEYSLDSGLSQSIQKIKSTLPETTKWKKFRKWWFVEGENQLEVLRETLLEFKSIGYTWEFTDEQARYLKRCYDLNKFLAELQRIDGAVSKEFICESEESLLRPFEH